mgnify:FL=1|jgi:hypothetical protein
MRDLAVKKINKHQLLNIENKYQLLIIFNTLPEDCINYIWEYYIGIKDRSEHRFKFIPMLDNIILNSIQIIYFNTPAYTFAESWGKDECRRMLGILSNCSCCEDHQKRRPTIKEFDEGFVPSYSTSLLNREKSCKCFCRSISRHICRDVNDEEID